MKRTTKIMIGMTLGAWLIAVMFVIIYFFNTSSKDIFTETKCFFKAGEETRTLPSFKFIVTDINNELDYNRLSGDFSITCSKDTLSSITFPKEISKTMKSEVQNDTLFIRINNKDLNIKKHHDYLSGLLISLKTPSCISFASLKNSGNDIQYKLELGNQDSLTIDKSRNFTLNNSNINCLTINNSRNFDINKCSINDLHIDLDGVRNWNTNDSKIEREWFSASERNSYSTNIDKNECKEIYFDSKEKDAKLVLTVQNAKTIRLE